MSRLNKKLRVALASIALSTVALAAIAVAQQPMFRFNMSGGGPVTTPDGPPVPVPPTKPNNDGKVDFGSGGTAPFTLRALVGEPVSLEFGTIGGTNPITWLTAPPIPSGLLYADGVISGTPSAPAQGAETFGAQDATGKQAQARVTFDIYNAAVSLHQFKPVVRVGSPYEGFVASNVSEPSYSVSGLPGAVLGVPAANARAAFGGVATTAGTFPFTVSVSRPGTSISGIASQQVRVADPLAIAFDPPVLPPLSGPVSVAATTRNAVGTAPLQVVGQTNALQARGLNYSNGTLSGTLGVGPATSLTLRATDSADAAQAEASLPIPEILATQASIVIGESRPGDAFKAANGSAVPATIQTQIPNPICTVTQAVPGLNVSSNCTITGAATSPGAYTLTISLVPASNPQAEPVVASAPVTVHPTLVGTPSQAHSTPGPGAVIHLTVNTSGVVGTPSFELVGVTPSQLEEVGLSFDPATGEITGEIDPGVSISPQVKLTDSKDGKTVTVVFSIVSAPANVFSGISATTLRSGDVRTFQATSNIANAVFSLVDAPEYYVIDPQSGLITATAPDVQALTTIPGFAVRASHPSRPGVFKQTTVSSPGSIRPRLVLSVQETATGRGNVALDIPFTTAGATSPSVTLQAGSLPVGMSLAASSISGKPTVPGSYPVTLVLRDGADGRTTTATLAITIGASLDFTLTSSLAPVGKGYIGTPLAILAQTANVLGTVSFENIEISGRPGKVSEITGLALDPATGTISGTPQSSYTKVANIRMTEVHEGKSTTIDKPLTFSINAPATAASTIPTVTLDGVDVTAQVYDAEVAATSLVLGAGKTLIYTFPDDVTVNGIVMNAGFNVTVKNLTTSQTATTTGTNFTATTSATWSVTLNSTYTVGTMRLAYNSASAVAPRIVPTTATTANVVADADVTLNNNGYDTVGTVNWSATGLPSGLAINPTTGTITGRASAIGEYDVVVALSDSRGAAAYPRAFKLVVNSSVSASTIIPEVTGVETPSIQAKLMDFDNYDESSSGGDSTVTIPAGGQLTFTYPQPVVMSTFHMTTAVGSPASPYVGIYDDQNRNVGNFQSNYHSMTMRTSSSFRVVNISGNPIRVARMAFGYSSYGPTLPNVAETLTRSVNAGANASVSLRAYQQMDVGATYSFTLGVGYATGATTFQATGPLPPGMTFDSATGVLSGTPTTTGTYQVSITTTDSRGIPSVAKQLNFVVEPTATAGVTLPVVTGVSTSPDLARSILMDASSYETSYTDGASALTLPAGATVTYTFPTPVKANYLTVNWERNESPGQLVVRNESLGTQILSATGSNYFSPVNGSNTSVGSVYSVTNNSGRALRLAGLAIAMGGSYVSLPSIAPDNNRFRSSPTGNYTNGGYVITSKQFWSVNAYYDILLATSGSQGAVSYSLGGGTLPPGIQLSATEGKIYGTPTTPGDYTFSVVVTDSRSLSSVPRTVNVRVLTDKTPANVLATLSGVADPAAARAAWFDANPYDVSYNDGPSKYVLPAGATVTFTYPETVKANTFSFQLASGSPAATFRIRNETLNRDVLNGVTSSGAFSAFDGTSDSEGTVFSVTNTGASAATIANMSIAYGYNYLVTPSINVTNYSVRWSPTGSYSSTGTMLSTKLYLSKGAYFDYLLSYYSGQSPFAWSVVAGSLPPGLELTASGNLRGTFTTPGEYAFSVAVSDNRGLTSTPVPMRIRVLTDKTPANVLATLSGVADPAAARAAWFDANPYDVSYNDGPSKYVLPAGATVTFTYPETVKANTFSFQLASGSPAATFRIRNETLNRDVLNGVTSSGAFSAFDGTSDSEGTVFSVTNTGASAATIANMSIAYGYNYLVTPSIRMDYYNSRSTPTGSYSSVSTSLTLKQFLTQGQYFDILPTYYSGGSPFTWSVTSGSLPPGLDLTSAGNLRGTVTTPGEYAFSITLTDSRGLTSPPVPMSFRVLTNRNATTTLPTVTGNGISDPDAALIALYDNDPYDQTNVDGNSKLTVPANGVLTFTYPETVTLNYFSRAVVSGASYGSIEIRNETTNQVVYSGNQSAAYFNAVNGTNGSEGTVFSVRNTSGAPAPVANLRLLTNGAGITFPYLQETVYLSVNGGAASYPTLRQRHVFVAGTSYQWFIQKAGGAGAPYTVTFDGPTPTGMSVSPSGGFTGVPTAPGDYTGTFRVTDSAGRSSVSKPYLITVVPAQSADSTIPSVSGFGGADLTARLHDNETSTSSVEMPAGATATFTFPVPVRANGFRFVSSGTGSFEVRDSNGTVVYAVSNQAAGTKSFTGGLDGAGLTYGTTFTVRNTGASAITLQSLRITYGGGFNWPTITEPTAAQMTFARTGAVSYTFGATYAAAGTRTWSLTGDLPAGFSFNTSTGTLSRSAAGPAAESKTVTIGLSDSRDLAAVQITVTITVN